MRASRTRNNLLGVATAGLLFCLNSSLSAGTVTITLTEDGGGAGVISVSLSGSLDWSSTPTTQSANATTFLNPQYGALGLIASPLVVHKWQVPAPYSTLDIVSTTTSTASNSIWGNYGTGSGFGPGLSYTGTAFTMLGTGLFLDSTIASGEAISGSGTFSGTFASLGITPGTVTNVFKLGGASGVENTIVIQTQGANASVPGLGGLAALACGVTGLRRNRRRVV